MNCELISVGTEILLGDIVNTNSQYLSKRLADLGLTMMMAVDVTQANVPLATLCQQMEAKGQEMGLSIRVQREDIFEAMHRV